MLLASGVEGGWSGGGGRGGGEVRVCECECELGARMCCVRASGWGLRACAGPSPPPSRRERPPAGQQIVGTLALLLIVKVFVRSFVPPFVPPFVGCSFPRSPRQAGPPRGGTF